MAGVEVRGSVVRPVRLTVTTTGAKHICPSILREAEFRATTNNVRVYFEQVEFDAGSDQYLLIVAGEAPRLLRIETPHMWFQSEGANATLELLQFCRRG